MSHATARLSIARFANCQSRAETDDLSKELSKEFNETLRVIRKARNERQKELRRQELNVFHQEARRWKSGQKVYFGTALSSFSLDWNFVTIKGSEKNIKKGDWCRVWEYQPKAKRLWLCKPGTKCEYKNIINSSFSLADIQHHKISRTELAIRK